MAKRMSELFLDHPKSVGESYGQHFAVAMSYSGRMAVASFCAFVHALLPFMFEKTASTMVKAMVAEMNSRMNKPTEVAPAE